MKYKHTLLLTILFMAAIFSTSFAQDNTQVGLPEGAIARLGKGRVTVMRFSSDGAHLAVGTTVGVWLYDVKTGNAKALFPAQPRHADNKQYKSARLKEWNPKTAAYVNILAFSPDNRILAVGESDNGVIQLWDVESGKELLTLPLTMEGDSVSAMAFSVDGKTLITPNKFGDIIHWDVATGDKIVHINNYRPELALLEEDGKYGMHSLDVLAFSQDGKDFVSGDPKEGKIRLWDAVTGRQHSIFKAKSKFAGISREEPEPQKGVNALAFSPDEKTVASGNDDNTVRLWDIASATEIATLKGHNERINRVIFSPDSIILASASTDKTIMLWDVIKKKRKQVTLTGHRAGIRELTFSPDGKILASGSMDGTVQFWDVNTGNNISTFATGHTGYIKNAAFYMDDTILTSASSIGTVQIWNVEKGRELPAPNVAHYGMTEGLAFSTDATLFASHGADTTVRSRGNNTRISWSSHREIRLWGLPNGEELLTLPQSCKMLTFSPDNKILAASDTEETVLWDVKTGTERFRLNDRQFPTDVVAAFSPDGTMIATGGIQGQTHLWNVNTGDKIETLNAGIREYTQNLVFSPDSSVLIVGYVNNHIRIWDLKTKRERNTPLTTQNKVWIGQLKVSPDGKTLLIATRDFKIPKEIELWDVEMGTKLSSFRTGHTLGIQTLVFSHDGKTLATGDADGTILLWDWDKIIAKVTSDNKGD